MCHGFVQITFLLGRFALLVVCGSLMVLHEKYAKEPWRHIGLKVPHHPPPPRFDSPLRAVSGTTKQLQHTKHLQRPAQQRQQQQHQQQQQTTQRQQQQQHTQRRGSSSRSRPPSASSSSSSRRPGACRAPSAAAPSAAAAAAAPAAAAPAADHRKPG